MTMKEREAALNHRMKAVKNDQAAAGASFGCECADLRCNAKLELTEDERGRRSSRPSRFWVKPGHELVYTGGIRSIEHFPMILGE